MPSPGPRWRLATPRLLQDMGEVWRARHQLLARPCAVKLIRPELLGEKNREAATERFRLEARTISRLSSPNTVRLYDFGLSETGSFYLVMRWVYLRPCRYATSPSSSAAGRFAHFFGIGGFLVEFALAAIATGSTIHARMSSAESFAPTPSNGFCLFPLPVTAWQTWHFWAV